MTDKSAREIDDYDENFYDAHEPDDCDHTAAEIDCLIGRMTCHCGYSKWLTTEELRRELTFQAAMYEAHERYIQEELAASNPKEEGSDN